MKDFGTLSNSLLEVFLGGHLTLKDNAFAAVIQGFLDCLLLSTEVKRRQLAILVLLLVLLIEGVQVRRCMQEYQVGFVSLDNIRRFLGYLLMRQVLSSKRHLLPHLVNL